MGSKRNSEMVNDLYEDSQVRTQKVERVLRLVDRDIFAHPMRSGLGYGENVFRTVNLHPGQIHISAPSIYCTVVEMLDLHRGQSFLNIGSGSGYLSCMVGFLIGESGISHGVELHSNVVEHSKEAVKLFSSQKFIAGYDWCRPQFVHGNAFKLKGLSRKYDRIYIGAQIAEGHLGLFQEMLKVDGILIAPIGPPEQTNARFQRVKRTKDDFERVDFMGVTFAGLVLPHDEERGRGQEAVSSSRKRKIEFVSNNPNDCVLFDLLALFKPKALSVICAHVIRKRIADNIRMSHPIAIVQKLRDTRVHQDVLDLALRRHQDRERAAERRAQMWGEHQPDIPLPPPEFVDFAEIILHGQRERQLRRIAGAEVLDLLRVPIYRNRTAEQDEQDEEARLEAAINGEMRQADAARQREEDDELNDNQIMNMRREVEEHEARMRRNGGADQLPVPMSDDEDGNRPQRDVAGDIRNFERRMERQERRNAAHLGLDVPPMEPANVRVESNRQRRRREREERERRRTVMEDEWDERRREQNRRIEEIRRRREDANEERRRREEERRETERREREMEQEDRVMRQIFENEEQRLQEEERMRREAGMRRRERIERRLIDEYERRATEDEERRPRREPNEGEEEMRTGPVPVVQQQHSGNESTSSDETFAQFERILDDEVMDDDESMIMEEEHDGAVRELVRAIDMALEEDDDHEDGRDNGIMEVVESEQEEPVVDRPLLAHRQSDDEEPDMDVQRRFRRFVGHIARLTDRNLFLDRPRAMALHPFRVRRHRRRWGIVDSEDDSDDDHDRRAMRCPSCSKCFGRDCHCNDVNSLRDAANRALQSYRGGRLYRRLNAPSWVQRITRLADNHKPKSFADQMPGIFEEELNSPAPNGHLTIEDWYLQKERQKFTAKREALEKAVFEVGRAQFEQEEGDFLEEYNKVLCDSPHTFMATFKNEEDSILRFEKKLVEELNSLPLSYVGLESLKNILYEKGKE